MGSHKKHLFFISDSVPNKGSFASEVIFQRHLERFSKEGYKITIFTSRKELNTRTNIDFPSDWNVHCFSTERLFPLWFIKRYRLVTHCIYLLEVLLKTGNKRPSSIFSYLWGVNLCTFAAFLAKFYNCKLFYFLHDDARAFGEFHPKYSRYIDELYSYCLKACSRIYSVTTSLAINVIKSNTRLTEKKSILNKVVQLLPIPEAVSFERIRFSQEIDANRRIVFSGTIYDEYFPLFTTIDRILSKMKGELILITKDHARISKLITQHHLKNTVALQSFTSNITALHAIHEMKALLLIGYPEHLEKIQWARDSFPSKFVEYSFLGLPCLLIAPSHSEFYRWCTKNTAIKIFTPDNIIAIERYVEALFTAKGWNKLVDEYSLLGNGPFSPIRIHTQVSYDAQH